MQQLLLWATTHCGQSAKNAVLERHSFQFHFISYPVLLLALQNHFSPASNCKTIVSQSDFQVKTSGSTVLYKYQILVCYLEESLGSRFIICMHPKYSQIIDTEVICTSVVMTSPAGTFLPLVPVRQQHRNSPTV